MDGTVKTVLIVGGVAIGAYLVLELVRGQSPITHSTTPSTSSSGSYAVVGSLANLATSIVNSYNRSGGSSAPPSSSSFPTSIISSDGLAAPPSSGAGDTVYV